MSSDRYLLIVDDGESDVLIMRLALKKAGISCAVEVARDGRDAVNFLSAIAKEKGRAWPQLVLLDLRMPGMDGFEFLKWWTEHNLRKELPIVVMSSSPLESDIEKAMGLGAAAYISKPADFAVQIEIARELEQRWLQPRTEAATTARAWGLKFDDGSAEGTAVNGEPAVSERCTQSSVTVAAPES